MVDGGSVNIASEDLTVDMYNVVYETAQNIFFDSLCNLRENHTRQEAQSKD